MTPLCKLNNISVAGIGKFATKFLTEVLNEDISIPDNSIVQ